MTTLTIRIPESLHKDLKSLSRTENRPVSEIVRDSIRRHVAIKRFRAVRNQTLPFAEARGILSDEDVFHALK